MGSFSFWVVGVGLNMLARGEALANMPMAPHLSRKSHPPYLSQTEASPSTAAGVRCAAVFFIASTVCSTFFRSAARWARDSVTVVLRAMGAPLVR